MSNVFDDNFWAQKTKEYGLAAPDPLTIIDSKKETVSKVETTERQSGSSVCDEVAQAIENARGIVGADGTIIVGKSSNKTTEVDIVPCMHIERGYISYKMCTDMERMEALLDNPLILITEKRISSIHEILEILTCIVREGRSMLVIAEDVEDEVLETLILNKERGSFTCVAVRAPGFGDRRKAMLQDIAIVTGGQVIMQESGMELEKTTIDMLGTARWVKIGREDTAIIEGGGDRHSVIARVDSIRNQIERTTSDYDREKMQERIALMSCHAAEIKAGAETEIEKKKQVAQIEAILRPVNTDDTCDQEESAYDETLNRLITDAKEKAGQDSIIILEESLRLYTTLDTVQSMKIQSGYIADPKHIDAEGKEYFLNDPLILLTDNYISSIESISGILDQVVQHHRSLLIVAKYVDEQVLNTLGMIKQRGALDFVAISLPDFGDSRKAIMLDIAVFIGSEIISDDFGLSLSKTSIDMLGSAHQVRVTKEETTFIEGKGDSDEIKARIVTIRSQIEDANSDSERELLQKRLNRLVGKAAVIKVGGYTEEKMKMRFNQIRNALTASKQLTSEEKEESAGTAVSIDHDEEEFVATTSQEDNIAKDNESIIKPATEEKEVIHMATLNDDNVQIDDILKIAKPLEYNGLGKELFKMLDRFTECLGTFSRDYYEACNSRDKDIAEQEADAKKRVDQHKKRYEIDISTLQTEREAQKTVIKKHRDEDIAALSSSETRDVVEAQSRLQASQNENNRWQHQQEEEISALARQQNAKLSQLNSSKEATLRTYFTNIQDRMRKAETEVGSEIEKLYNQVVELIKLTFANANRITGDMEVALKTAKMQEIPKSRWDSILSAEYVKQANELYDAIYNECKKIFRRRLPELCKELAAKYGRVLSVIETMRQDSASKHEEINNDYETRKSDMRRANQEELSAKRRTYAAEKDARAQQMHKLAQEEQRQESKIKDRYEKQIAEKKSDADKKLNEVEANYGSRIIAREAQYELEGKEIAEHSAAEAVERKATWASDLERRKTSFIQKMEAIFPAKRMQELFEVLDESKHHIDHPMVSMERPMANITIGIAHVPILSNEDKHGESYPIIADLLKERYSFMLRNQLAASVELSIPYMLSVDDGTAFLIKYKDRFEENVKNWVNGISIRTLWSIPASLQEFCLLDTGAIGSFASLQHLDPSQNPSAGGELIKSIIIGGKVFQKKEDMAKQIEEMRTRFENRKGSMGSHSTLRAFNEKNFMSREAYQSIIIQHFPTNLSGDSILDLTTLARDCRRSGFSTILAMPDSSEQYMEEKVAPRVKDFEAYATVLRVEGKDQIKIQNGATTRSEKNATIVLYDVPADNRLTDMRDEYYSIATSALKVTINFNSVAPRKEDRFAQSSSQGLVVPLGLLRGGSKFELRMDDIHIHTILSGVIRSGKTNLLHTLIMNIMLNYSPDEAEIYLIDFKHGVDFGIYSNYNLPNFKVLSITSEVEFPLAVLEEINKEFDRRAYDLEDTLSIAEYNRLHPDNRMKRIVLIMDELYVLMKESAAGGNNRVAERTMEIVDKIAHTAGAFGIHMLICGQDMTKIDGIENVINQCANRIVMHSSDDDVKKLLNEGDASILMHEIKTSSQGTCVFSNDYAETAKLAYTAYVSPECQAEVLSSISQHYTGQGKSANVRILLTEPSKSKYHPFRLFVDDGTLPPIEDVKRDARLYIGQPLTLIKEFNYFPDKNLWVLGGESGEAELAGYGVMFSCLLSLLLIKLKERENGRRFEIYCSDGHDDGAEDIDPNDRFWQFCDALSDRKGFFKYLPGSEIGMFINELTKTIAERKAKKDPEQNYPIWFLISAAEECFGLKEQDRQALRKILDDGHTVGVHVIIWTRDVDWVKRIQMAATPCDRLVLETPDLSDYGVSIRQNNAAGYKAQLMGSVRARLRLYDLPVQPWVERILTRMDRLEDMY